MKLLLVHVKMLAADENTLLACLRVRCPNVHPMIGVPVFGIFRRVIGCFNRTAVDMSDVPCPEGSDGGAAETFAKGEDTGWQCIWCFWC